MPMPIQFVYTCSARNIFGFILIRCILPRRVCPSIFHLLHLIDFSPWDSPTQEPQVQILSRLNSVSRAISIR